MPSDSLLAMEIYLVFLLDLVRTVVEVRVTTGWKPWLETQISILNIFKIQGLRLEFWVFISDLRFGIKLQGTPFVIIFCRWRAAEAGRKATANTTWAAETTRGLWKLILSRQRLVCSPMTRGLSTWKLFIFTTDKYFHYWQVIFLTVYFSCYFFFVLAS